MPYSYFEWIQWFFIVHSTIGSTVHSRTLNSLEHCICTTTMTNIRPDRDTNLVPPGYKPQSIRMSHRGRPLYSVAPMFRRFHVQKVLSSEATIFWSSYIQNILYWKKRGTAQKAPQEEAQDVARITKSKQQLCKKSKKTRYKGSTWSKTQRNKWHKTRRKDQRCYI